MTPRKLWTVRSFLTCFLMNAAMLWVLYYISSEILRIVAVWVAPFLKAGPAALPEDVHAAFVNLSKLLIDLRQYLAVVLFGLGGFTTLVLWILLLVQGRRLAKQVEASQVPGKQAAAGREKPATQSRDVSEISSPESGAVQMLSLLQRDGRLIDFLEEDITTYDDAQIGAAVRGIHQSCKAALDRYVQLLPILQDNEGAEVTISPGFDQAAVKLTGNVSGDPPFKGTLRHRGWRAVKVQLPPPSPAPGKKQEWVLAPAEVDLP